MWGDWLPSSLSGLAPAACVVVNQLFNELFWKTQLFFFFFFLFVSFVCYFLIFQQLSLKLIGNCASGSTPSPCIILKIIIFMFLRRWIITVKQNRLSKHYFGRLINRSFRKLQWGLKFRTRSDLGWPMAFGIRPRPFKIRTLASLGRFIKWLG